MNRLLVPLCLSLLISCSDAVKPSVSDLFHDYHEFKLKINPIEATKGGANEYNAQLVDFISDEHQELLKNSYGEFLFRAAEIDRTALSPEDLLSLRVLEWDSEIKLEGLNNELVTIASPMFDLPNFELFPITQIASLQLYVGQLAGGSSIQPFETVSNYDDWLTRVDAYLIWLDTAESKMREGMEKGIMLPRVLAQRAHDQLLPFIGTPTEDHLFFAPAKMMPEVFYDQDKSRLEEAFRSMVDEKIRPRYESLATFMRKEYLPLTRESSGISDLPHGPETYQYLIRLHTSTDMTPDEIHELGLSEVDRIEGEMRKVMSEIGYIGELSSFLVDVRKKKELVPFSDPQQVIDNFNSIQKELEPGVSNLFDLTPKAGFEVRRTEAFRENSASAEYVPGSKDATRPGVFYVPIPDVSSYNIISDEALFLHEAIPGHHFQLSLQQENSALPEFLHAEGMGVFVEGWALYSESLGKEMGIYNDPYQYFGMLSMEMHRAIRLVVDSGIHAKGWTREQAIEYSLEHEAESEASITSEIERYMATPGQALSYKIGQLTIRKLRTRAEEVMGDDFDVREFHNQVLNSGSLPMALLEEKIDAWIGER